ncbi:MAG TPA: excinuclease ABC subunit B, partial [candidate division Zixibacteria bacterium]|nr:excinuclease ABC subunit B [candidate division Zixibacteria bacterium]
MTTKKDAKTGIPRAKFDLHSKFEPKGDQPEAIKQLCEGLARGDKHQTLLGVTGSGKTFTIANVIAKTGRPALVMSHNKTLAAQLYGELKAFFPNNAVEFFISYYDYYQPEAYVPTTDTFIEKDTAINDDIDRLRLRATSSLLERDDVIIVASVSCIYGLGSPEAYKEQMITVVNGLEIDRDEMIRNLIQIHYNRNDISFTRGNFRVRGDTIELIPSYHEHAFRIEFYGDEVERISEIDPLTGEILKERDKISIYPAKHFITSKDQLKSAIKLIQSELKETVQNFVKEDKLLEAQRIESRTKYD